MSTIDVKTKVTVNAVDVRYVVMSVLFNVATCDRLVADSRCSSRNSGNHYHYEYAEVRNGNQAFNYISLRYMR